MHEPPLQALLETLCARLDSRQRQTVDSRFEKALTWNQVDHVPVIISAPPPPDEARFEPLPHSAIFESPKQMLYNELVHAFDLSILQSNRIRHDLPWTVRANFGTVLVASIFGCQVEQVGDNPPWVRHDSGYDLSPEAILDADIGSLAAAGWLPRVIETLEAYHDLLAPYPELREAIRITLPDLQGPFDNFEHLRGNDAFLDLIDEPEICSAAIRRVAEVQVEASRLLAPLCSDGPEGFCHQHGFMLRGGILLRCDSVIMVSADIYRDLIAPHDNWVMEQFGGGAIHSCGNIGHLVDAYLELPALQSLDIGQSEMNDRDALYAKARERKIALIRVHAEKQELEDGSFRTRYPTGIAAIHRASSFEAASSLQLPAYAETLTG